MKLKIGDRVQIIKKMDHAKVGMQGTIVSDTDSIHDYGVEFDQPFQGGHDLNGRCNFGYGHWVFEETLILLDDNDSIAPIRIPEKKENNLTF